MAVLIRAVAGRLLMPDRVAAHLLQPIFIAFGGNLGDVRANFDSARFCIARLHNTQLIDSSLLYRTPPLGAAAQPDYWNAVIAIRSALSPHALLDALQDIEAQHQRIRAEHWGPRTLDLDIIAIGEQSIDTSGLIVPHSEMQYRQFVLQPLCDIAASWQHPALQQSASQLLQSLLQGGETALPKGIEW